MLLLVAVIAANAAPLSVVRSITDIWGDVALQAAEVGLLVMHRHFPWTIGDHGVKPLTNHPPTDIPQKSGRSAASIWVSNQELGGF